MIDTNEKIEMDNIEKLIEVESASLLNRKKEWSLLHGAQDIEVVAHILRVILHIDKAKDLEDDFFELTKCQNGDGGWAPFSSDNKSEVWGSTFSAIMLIRANQLLNDNSITDSLNKFTDYLITNQKEDGLWTDPAWADIDAVSHPVQFLSLIFTLDNSELKEKARIPLERGIEFLLKNQDSDGGWSDSAFYKSCVCLTAHIIQDSLLPDLLISKRVPGDVYKKGVDRLVELQASNGSWDNNDVDHTCDTLRSLMLATVMLDDYTPEKMDTIFEKGIKWVISVKNEEGWGDFPNEKSNIERTSDAIDTLIKYCHYSKNNKSDLLKLWGYK